MTITKVHIRLIPDPQPPLLAFARIVFDNEFVIEDIKVLNVRGKEFAGMPTRQETDRCPEDDCRHRNSLKARYCNACGAFLGEYKGLNEYEIHHSVAHPITHEFRKRLDEVVMAHYRLELEKSKLPGYEYFQPGWRKGRTA